MSPTSLTCQPSFTLSALISALLFLQRSLALKEFLCFSNERISVVQSVESARLASNLMNNCLHGLLLKYGFSLYVMRSFIELGCMLFRIIYSPTRGRRPLYGKALQMQLDKNFNATIKFYEDNISSMKFPERFNVSVPRMTSYLQEFQQCFQNTITAQDGRSPADAVVTKTCHWLLKNVIW